MEQNISEETSAFLENMSEEILYYGYELNDEKQFKRLIKTLQFICRKSPEYDEWQKRTKVNAVYQNPDPDKDDSNECPVCGKPYSLVKPETHHHPATMYAIVENKIMEHINHETLSTTHPLELCFDIMAFHLADKVENVVLCKHCHEKHHSGDTDVTQIINDIIEYKREEKYKERAKKFVYQDSDGALSIKNALTEGIVDTNDLFNNLEKLIEG